jgi:hypothetical protein
MQNFRPDQDVPGNATLAVARIQEFTKIQVVPHGPTCCTSIALPHHRCELAVINLTILEQIHRLFRRQTKEKRTKKLKCGNGESRLDRK